MRKRLDKKEESLSLSLLNPSCLSPSLLCTFLRVSIVCQEMLKGCDESVINENDSSAIYTDCVVKGNPERRGAMAPVPRNGIKGTDVPSIKVLLLPKR